MANYFDQFDAPAPSGNYFDQFDTPAATPAAPAPSQPEGANPWLDTASSLASGVLRGGAETAMLPVTAGRLATSGGNWVHDRAEDTLRSIFGMEPISPGEAKVRDDLRNNNPINSALFGAQDAVRGGMDAVLHEPETTPGKYAETIGEFLAPGGIPSEATRLAPTLARKVGEYTEDVVRNAVLPGAASEAAGQATEGTPFEAPARVAGAVLGSGTSAIYKAANAPESVLRRAVGNPDDVNWNRATALQNNGTGVALTGPESIAQAQGGASALPDVMRVVEGSIDGGSVMAPFFAQRPGQVDAAVGGTLDKIAPQSAQPYSLGPRVADAGQQAILDVEKARTAAVEPFYKAADPTLVPKDDISTLLGDMSSAAAADKTGVLSGPLNEAVRILTATPAKAGTPATRTPVLGPQGQVIRYQSTPSIPATPAQPIVDIENLDRARKYLRDKMDLPQIGADAITKEQNAALTGYLAKLDDLMVQASPDFAAGKAKYADITENKVDPIVNGPLGNVAAANTTQSAGEAILPRNPLVGSQDESADAVIRLIMQDADSTKGLVRQNLADRFNAASTDTQQGANQFSGAKFAKDVSGNAQRDATLYAVLDALGAPGAKAAMPELLDVLQATGRRKPIGSATEFNRTINADLGNASPFARTVDMAKSLGASFITNAGGATKRVAQRNSTRALAQMFTDPDSVELIRMALSKGADTNFPEALLRVAAQTGPIMSGADE